METKNLDSSVSSSDNDLDLLYLFSLVWEKKRLVLSITSLAAILSVIFSLNLSNIYTSKSLLIPSQPEDSISSKIGDLSALGNIAGISLPESEVSQSQEGVARINSFDFFSNSFMPNIKLENLMAVKSWDLKNNKLIYDKKIFDHDTNTWVRKVKFPKKKKPSLQEAYEIFSEIFEINQDQKTSFVNISIDHHSPIIAKKWLDIIIYQINESMREADKEKAKQSIAFLNEVQDSTNIQAIKDVSSSLLEKQMQTLMLASSNQDYVFEIIDRPIAPEKKSKPSRSLICITGTILGFILSLLAVFIDHYYKKLIIKK